MLSARLWLERSAASGELRIFAFLRLVIKGFVGIL
jgi:hypothetical protein